MFPEFLRNQRKKLGLTQDAMAKQIGLSRPTYALIEKGERKLAVDEAEELAKLFDIPLADFLRGHEPVVTVTIGKGRRLATPAKEDIRISVPRQSAEKFRHVLLYLLKKAGGKPNVGMTVIYKLLYFIDFDYYEKNEEQLMGLAYLKNAHGPTPILFKKFIEDMIKDGEVEKIDSKFYKYPQTKYLVNPAINPDLSVLNGEEMEHIDWELQRLSDMTATQISDLSHKDVPWISAEDGKPLDYEAVFYRTAETSVREYASED